MACATEPATSTDPVPLPVPANLIAAPVDYEPAWSPDGSRLAFISNRDGPLNRYSVRIDGTGLRRLTSGTTEDDSPAWAPDGRSIVWNSSRRSSNAAEPGTFELFSMAPDGSTPAPLTATKRDSSGVHLYLFPAPPRPVR